MLMYFLSIFPIVQMRCANPLNLLLSVCRVWLGLGEHMHIFTHGSVLCHCCYGNKKEDRIK